MSTTVTVLEDKVLAVEVAGGFPQGNGIPSGGTAGQVLVKASSDNYDTEWVSSGAVPTWGGILGDIEDQTDLIAALDAAGRAYIDTSEPGTDTEDGDLWFDPSTSLLKVKASGSWTGQTLDDGHF